ncbi:MAG: hypothetical protein JWL64_1173 [Frankiales bacterium]|nr:hypothetical protein [Frankiales bacterium]
MSTAQVERQRVSMGQAHAPTPGSPSPAPARRSMYDLLAGLEELAPRPAGDRVCACYLARTAGVPGRR